MEFYILMRVDNCSQVDLAGTDLLFQNRCYSSLTRSAFSLSFKIRVSYSSGWAGSMITASLDFSSTTKYA